jgi:hypothetical protein
VLTTTTFMPLKPLVPHNSVERHCALTENNDSAGVTSFQAVKTDLLLVGVGVEKVGQHKVFLPASIASAKFFFSRCG